jgi:hypothetical protein
MTWIGHRDMDTPDDGHLNSSRLLTISLTLIIINVKFSLRDLLPVFRTNINITIISKVPTGVEIKNKLRKFRSNRTFIENVTEKGISDTQLFILLRNFAG